MQKYHIAPPELENNNLEPAINRLCCHRWWFKKIKTLRAQALDNLAHNIELVHKHRSCYAGDYVVKLKRKQKTQTRKYLESKLIINECGDYPYSLTVGSELIIVFLKNIFISAEKTGLINKMVANHKVID